jgi:hypothetical protein
MSLGNAESLLRIQHLCTNRRRPSISISASPGVAPQKTTSNLLLPPAELRVQICGNLLKEIVLSGPNSTFHTLPSWHAVCALRISCSLIDLEISYEFVERTISHYTRLVKAFTSPSLPMRYILPDGSPELSIHRYCCLGLSTCPGQAICRVRSTSPPSYLRITPTSRCTPQMFMFFGTLNDPSRIFCRRSPPSVHNGRCAGISSTLPKGSRQAHVETETSLTDDLWEYFSIRAVYMRDELRQCKIRIRFGGPDMEEVQVCVLGAVGGV